MNKILNFPIRVLLTFLIFTEILFFIGPRIWNINNSVLLVCYLLLMNAALYCGYKSGLKYSVRTAIGHFSINTIGRIVTMAFICKLTLFLVDNNFSVTSIISKLLNATNDFGQAYYDRDLDVNIVRYLIGQLLTPIVFAGYVFGIYYWKDLKKKYHIYCVLMIIIELISWISIGVRKGVCDIFIVVFVSWFLRNYDVLLNKKRWRRFKRYIAFVVFAFLLFFLGTNLSRMSQYDTFVGMFNDSRLPIRDFYLKYIPNGLTMMIMSIAGYLCQGYYALSKALEVGILSPNILATNMFTINVAEKFGLDPLVGSYLDVLSLNYGISPTVNWHSIYVWLANGFTFFGVPFFVYFIGFVFGNSWKRSIQKKDNIAMLLFVVMFQTIFYFFANNQVFSFSFVLVVCFMLVYLLNVGNKYEKKNFSCFS